MNLAAKAMGHLNVAKLVIPTGHGERLTAPDYEDWEALARTTAAGVAAWDFEVAGVPARELRARARRPGTDRR